MRGRNIPVLLTRAHLARVAVVAKERYRINREHGNEDRHGLSSSQRTAVEISGCLGELAYAIASGDDWQAVKRENYKASPDVGLAEVRHTYHEKGSLIVRPGDKVERPFVLVVGRPPQLMIVGWRLGRFCRNPNWRRAPNDRPSAWFVPQWALRPFPISLR